MRILLTSLITVYCFIAHGLELNIKSITNFRQQEGMFKLIDPENSKTIAVLDCQSFFQKLNIKTQGQLVREYYITESECYYLYQNTIQCLEDEKVKCIDTEDIFNPACNCQQSL